ncbi:hypothetical protein M441DRAFT_53968 [Trichoderma asperellum CBS 433.97]|uniref:Uncharacterized protein n=1 Tax=Trichoderma asperellum (strain ATCC 204424 / CBS 433.97 / NBRC 101777) TaxID=1042311 RepID=A0A2T3ZJ94_TRIA4|nr:hypothetical protein M441DRAFT_53968 [Trichoderma asperellum CBS 433.97]PTB44881.1 hypothetical protein M441DRAFT_53968 [Trichoderma asperellum CBS 433.97]
MLFFHNLLLLTTTAVAVNVIIFIVDSNHNCPNDETVLICSDIGRGICCTSTEFTGFPSLQVAGISTQPQDGNLAIAFSESGDNRCGVTCDSAFAENNACLTCGNDGISGGGWDIIPVKEQSMESLSSCTGSVKPDELRYQGRSYRIYHDVPENITAELIDLVNKKTNVADFPAHLAQYEKLNYGH